MKIKIEPNNIVLLCCGKKGCPSLRKEDGLYFLKDDSGSEVMLEKDHLMAIKEALAALEKLDG